MNIIVTGASRGIGYELVKILAENPTNKIITISRNKENLQKLVVESKHNNIYAFPFDLTEDAPMETILEEVTKKFSSVDVLVNNAGSIVNKPFLEITLNEVRQVFGVNVFGVFQLIQKLLPVMGKNTKSHIVNISSIGGFQGSVKFAGLSAYSASKSALVGLSECLAEELKDSNIAVNCLCLGAVQTEMLDVSFPGYKAPLTAMEMAQFIAHFAITGHKYFNGKVLPVSMSTP